MFQLQETQSFPLDDTSHIKQSKALQDKPPDFLFPFLAPKNGPLHERTVGGDGGGGFSSPVPVPIRLAS